MRPASHLVAIILGIAGPVAFTYRVNDTFGNSGPATLTLKERSGEVLTLVLADNAPVSEVVPIALVAIQPGSYIGTAAMPAFMSPAPRP